MKVLFIFRNPQLNHLLKNSQSKSGPTDFLYGSDKITLKNVSIDYLCIDKTPILFHPIQRLFAYLTKLGFPIGFYFKNQPRLKSADYIFCVNDGIGLAVLFWKMLGVINAKIGVIFQSLPERTKHFRNNLILKYFLSLLLKQANWLLTLSNYAAIDFIRDYSLNKSTVRTFSFGVDTKFWTPGKGKTKNFILSIGNDSNRDYQTLIEALPEDQQLIIISKLKTNSMGKNVKQLSNLSDRQVRDYYRQAKLVVIPNHKVKNESPGMSSALQALACGNVVILSDSPPLREAFKNNPNCILVPPDNKQLLKSVILKMLRHRRIIGPKVVPTVEGMGKFWEFLIKDQSNRLH